jgi:lysophosphatidylcholine acyltransferase/lyso-PAF acetyltransferase
LARDLTATLIVIAHFVAGFHHVKVKGVRATPKQVCSFVSTHTHEQAPVLVMAPHTSFYDALPFTMLGAPSIVAKKQVIKAPMFGSMFAQYQPNVNRIHSEMISLTMPIYVDRDCATSRKSTMLKIQKRAEHIQANGDHSNYPQVAIFPEATTTNAHALLQFKIGLLILDVQQRI